MEGRRAKPANSARTWARRAAPNRHPLNTTEHRNAKGVTVAGFPKGTSSSCEKALIKPNAGSRVSAYFGRCTKPWCPCGRKQVRLAKVGNAQYLTANTYRLRGSNTSLRSTVLRRFTIDVCRSTYVYFGTYMWLTFESYFSLNRRTSILPEYAKKIATPPEREGVPGGESGRMHALCFVRRRHAG